MTQRQFVAYAIIGSIALAVIGAFVAPENQDGFYAVAGLGMMGFGIWASVLLLRDK